MANHQSAVKRIRQNKRRRIQNRIVKGKMRSEIKAYAAALESGDVAKARELIGGAIKQVQRAGSKGVVHGNTVSRKVSRLTRALNRLTGSVQA